MGNVMHAKIEPQDEILVSQRLAIEELVEVNWWIGLVHGVEDAGRPRFCLLGNGEHEIPFGPSCRVEKHTRVFNGKMAGACIWHNSVGPVFSVSGLLVLVQDKHFLWSRRLPIKAALIFCLKETPFQFHRAVLSTLRPWVRGLDRDLVHQLYRVVGAEDIKVSLEVDDVIV